MRPDPVIMFLTGSLCCVVGASCGSRSPGHVTYQVDVRGSSRAFEGYVVAAPGFGEDPIRYKTPWYSELLTMQHPLDCQYVESSMLAVTQGGGSVGSTTLRPFLCRNHPECAARLASGWHATEKHQVFLTDDGSLLKNNDWEHDLSYECVWTSPDGQSGDGNSWPQSTLGQCLEADRSGTDVGLFEVASGQLWARGGPTVCNSFLVGSNLGPLVVQVAFADSSFLNLSYCLPPTGHEYPITISAQDLISSKCDNQGAQLDARIPIEGYWTIDEADFSRNGWQRGYISMTFGNSSGGDQRLVEGAIQLPIVQVQGRSCYCSGS